MINSLRISAVVLAFAASCFAAPPEIQLARIDSTVDAVITAVKQAFVVKGRDPISDESVVAMKDSFSKHGTAIITALGERDATNVLASLGDVVHKVTAQQEGFTARVSENDTTPKTLDVNLTRKDITVAVTLIEHQSVIVAVKDEAAPGGGRIYVISL
jgi:cytochrome c556